MSDAKSLEKLRLVFSSEQLEQLAELVLTTYDMAVTRKSNQEVTVAFNDKGFPIGFNGSNNVRPVKPTNYKAE